MIFFCRHSAPAAFRRAARFAAPVLVLVLIGAVFVHAPGRARAQEGVVEEIIVRGNQRIEAETVRTYMQLKVGDPYSELRADLSLKSLYATGLFSDIEITRDGVRLIVAVEENPVINLIAVEGNDQIGDEDILAAIPLSVRSVYNRVQVQDALQIILQQYRRLGRFAASVEPKIIRLTQNRINLVFEVDEGVKTGIAGIHFFGNRAFTDSELRSQIATSVSAWWRFLTSNDTYDPDRLQVDVQLLRRFYVRRGFADFRVLASRAELVRDRSGFIVSFAVEEGRRYRFGDTRFNIRIEEIDRERLTALVRYEKGQTYDAFKVARSLESINTTAQELGYAFVSVEPRLERDREQGVVNIVWEIGEGARSYVEAVAISGNTITQDRVIRRQIKIAEGDVFNRVLLAKSERNLRALGFFEGVSITPRRGSAPDRVVLDTALTERPTGEITLGLGFSSADGFLGEFALRQNNFLGRGQTIGVELAYSTQRRVIDLSFIEPFFLDRDLRLGGDVFYLTNDFQNVSGYDRLLFGGRASLDFPVGEDARLRISYGIEQEDIFDIAPNASQLVRDAAGEVTRSILGYRYLLDRRDDVRNPRDGWLFLFEQDIAGLAIGDIRYVSTQSQFRYYIPIAETASSSYIGALRLAGGYVTAWGGERLRISDHFTVGGTNFRGFRLGGAGSRDLVSGNALGANSYLVLTSELRVVSELFLQFGLTPIFFVESGFAGGYDGAGANIAEERAFRISAGISLYWDSPIGPIRLDFSDVLIREPHDRTETFRLRAGLPF